LASAAYGTRPGDPHWNPDADLKEDGIIDIYDVILLSMHFGQKI
jgi:hypothetical protein